MKILSHYAIKIFWIFMCRKKHCRVKCYLKHWQIISLYIIRELIEWVKMEYVALCYTWKSEQFLFLWEVNINHRRIELWRGGREVKLLLSHQSPPCNRGPKELWVINVRVRDERSPGLVTSLTGVCHLCLLSL